MKRTCHRLRSRWNYRDTIEDELVIGGIGFRFIDTAGIREKKMWWKALVSKDFRKNRTGTTGYLFNG
jgi:tRNA modification GTPase